MPGREDWNRFLKQSGFIHRWRYQIVAGALVIGALVLFFCAGCAPSSSEWARVDAMPEGPAKQAEIAKLESRVRAEFGWWDIAGWAGVLAGGFIPGAGVAVEALRRGRASAIERARKHETAAAGLVLNIDGIMELVPEERKKAAVEWLKKKQEELGIRETVRGYLADE